MSAESCRLLKITVRYGPTLFLLFTRRTESKIQLISCAVPMIAHSIAKKLALII